MGVRPFLWSSSKLMPNSIKNLPWSDLMLKGKLTRLSLQDNSSKYLWSLFSIPSTSLANRPLLASSRLDNWSFQKVIDGHESRVTL
jgi:hypothetical protein